MYVMLSSDRDKDTVRINGVRFKWYRSSSSVKGRRRRRRQGAGGSFYSKNMEFQLRDC